MSKSCIFYTDSMIGEPIKSAVEKRILEAGLPIVSCSLRPLDFGKNFVYEGSPSFITYMNQIRTALENSEADYVFFCEHDILYPKCHFDFTPPRDDTYYYNTNVWRWYFGSGFAVTYDHLVSLSGLCCNRKLALDQYTQRITKALTMPPETNIREPSWARKWGYEPGTKRMGNGGFSELAYEMWRSDIPIVDIRHYGTISKAKISLEDFKHPPENFQQIRMEDIPGWNLKEVFP